MEKNLEGQVAIVTGGGRDIGRYCSIRLAERGASVVVNYNSSRDAAEETVRMIEEADGTAISVQADVTDESQVQQLVNTAREEYGDDIHVLVNNAGGLVDRVHVSEMDSDFWDKVINLNLRSAFLVTRAVIDHMPDEGAIVNLSSLAARNGGGYGSLAYATSKGGILTFTRGLAKELSDRKIRVNAVSPGLIDTTFHDTHTSDEKRKSIVESGILLGREGTPDDIGKLVAFLASDEASFINGESVEINGGAYFV